MSGPPPSRWDVVVLGAGASGLFCAAACGRRGRTVLVLDHAAQTGSKVRISGGGRCNFTNLDMGAEHFRSANPHFARSALARFTPRDVLDLLARHRIPWEEREAGQLFCARSARDIVSLLERECREAGATVLLGRRIAEVRREGGFLIRGGADVFRASSLVVATGGLSYAALGASGLGLDLARRFGLAVVEPRPALVPFVFAEPERGFFRGMSGVSLDAAVSCGGRGYRGNVLFTHRGLSGPAVLQASLRWGPGEPVTIDLLPATDILAELLAQRRGAAQMRTLLATHLPKRFAAAWCAREGIDLPLREISEKAARGIAARLHAWGIVPGGTEGYRTAEATSGGVDTDELSSKTMEARKVPGLHFVGEVVDVTGEVGGYNLHWAWASGHAAGEHA